MAKALILTEKPSVARDIAGAIGGFTEHDGYWESEDHLLTFAVGHLFELLEPEELDPKYKRWTLDVLPILPERFELKKKKGQSDRIRVIKSLATREDVDRIVNACDAGREGELIFREVVSFLGVEKPVERLWLQSMTTDAIRRGFASLRPGSELEGLGQASECRARADWLIGMNATRALTKRLKSRRETRAWSAGRVQTPTLALLVDRELEVLAHVPVSYWRVLARFEHGGNVYEGAWYDPAFVADDDDQRKEDRIFDEARARAIVEAARGHAGSASETRKPSRESAPPLFDLTSLQREGNRRFGWSARRVLGAAQRCYEAHKVLTYPRTDSRCLPSDYRETVDEVLDKLAAAGGEDLADYARAARHLKASGLENTTRVFDDAGVSDHFAIIPTGVVPKGEMRGDDRRLYDLVVRRFLGAFHPPAVWERVERSTEVSGERFRTRARALMEPGWRSVLAESQEEEAAPLAPLQPGADSAAGVAVVTEDVHAESEETRPPARITEARLLSLMENAGKNIEDEDLARVLHDKGLGTPATRAETIENLIAKGYVIRVGKALRPTVKGVRLIDTLRRIQIDRLASAELTGEIEQHLAEVESGGRSAAHFMGEMADYAREIVERAKGFEYEELYANEPDLGACPACTRPVREYARFYRCVPLPGVEEARAAKAKEPKTKPKKTKKGEAAKPEPPPVPEGPEDCPLRFWKDTSGRYVDRATVAALLRDGKSGLLEGFVARGGRTYKGHLEVDHDEWRVKVVSEGWTEESASETPEYDVNETPLGPCPQDASCSVVETPTHFACSTRIAADEAQAAYREARREARERKQEAPPKPEPPSHPGVLLPRTVCKREITRDEALVYLREGKTDLLPDFTSRFGRPFSAYLVLKENGRHGFEFPPRGEGAGRKAAAGKGKKSADAVASPKPRKVAARRKKATRRKTVRKGTARKGAARKGTARKGAVQKETGATARRPSSK